MLLHLSSAVPHAEQPPPPPQPKSAHIHVVIWMCWAEKKEKACVACWCSCSPGVFIRFRTVGAIEAFDSCYRVSRYLMHLALFFEDDGACRYMDDGSDYESEEESGVSEDESGSDYCGSD